ncbi:microtubule-associated protein 70-1 [Cryptomeria japonica]|uniref:microtubule-associated protein 70-1 n=1 Tax=Cryptomeria japonica TaxID=3369 RepID=UPI0027DA8310|nr:microtubule-associated protein 70-1 [Cryptomeria japonica]
MSDSYSFLGEDDYLLESVYGNGRPPVPDSGGPVLTANLSFKSDGKNKKKHVKRQSMDGDEILNLMHGSDPVKVELNRLENEVRDKDRELGEAQAEIKALKLSERAREKAVEELTEELNKLDEKLKANEILLENKNLEIKKINDEKKAALAAQFAAEATLRRVHAAQKDDDMPPIEAILAPLEAELKLHRQEIAKLQEDNRALERLTKSKEAALLDAERTVQIALAKASMVDDLQNRNQELMKQIEICQEENKILDKIYRQKVAEVEKLSQTVRELEEEILARGAAANAVRDYQRKVHEINEEKKTLNQELARAKVSANRVAVVVANEWKDGNDKVMPVKQWLEERRIMQGEMQQLRDKLAIAERTARSEAQLKEKFQLRLKVVEEGLRSSSNGTVRSEARSSSNGRARRQSLGGAEIAPRITANGLGSKKPSLSQLRSSVLSNTTTVLKNAKGTSRSFDGGRSFDGSRSVDRNKPLANGNEDHHSTEKNPGDSDSQDTWKEISEKKPPEFVEVGQDDTVSGLLYDTLQKEVIVLRKASYEKDQSLKDKDDAIEMLSKKVETLNKALEVEGKKMRREMAIMEKEIAAMRLDKEHDQRARRLSNSKTVNNSHLLSGRSARNS